MHSHLGARKPLGRAAAAIVFTLMLGACSSVPDWANPVEWYQGTSDWIGGEDEGTEARAEARRSEKMEAGGDKAFPTLSTVPERPKRVASKSRRSKVESALVADRDRARHEALAPGDSPPSMTKAVPGAPPPAVIAPPPALKAKPAAPPTGAVTPVTGTNQAFQAAIAQQAGNFRPTPPIAPAAGNTGPVPTLGQGNITFPRPLARGSTFGAGRRFGAGRGFGAGGGFGAGRSVQVGTVLFANGSSRIRKKYYKILRDIVRLQRQRGGNLRVVGHASSRTRNTNPLRHKIANFRISVARAKAVARRLVRYGAPAGYIQVTGVADSQRVYQEIMPSGEAGNRRAEIYLDY